MEKWKKRAVDLLTSLAFGSKGSPSVVPYYPQKTDVSFEEEKSFKRSVPEKHGISSKRIYNMLAELEAEPRANIHSLLVIKDSEVIAECSRDGYSTTVWHLSHSMSKSVTGIAVGFLYDDGILQLDKRVCELFPDVKYKDKRFGAMTVGNLLNMTSGVPFNEVGAVTAADWTDAFFGSALKFAPGEKFAYNSMNSYILARIVELLSGKRFIDYVEERLFSPLGIHNYFWERGPEGTEKGGWGLYMSAESWAKVGLMMLSGGEYCGKRILSEEWIRLSTSPQAETPSHLGDFDYGYQLWVGRNTDEILFNGMLGQNVWICPKNNIVAVVFSGNNELFQDSPTMEILRRHLGCDISDVLEKEDVKVLAEKETSFFDSRRWVVPLEKRQGLLQLLRIRHRTPFDERFTPLLGRYVFATNNVGILPLFVSAMQNNLDTQIKEISFEREGEELWISVKEGTEEYRLTPGFYEYKSNILNIRGEKYILKLLASATVSSDNIREYRIEFLFPEMPNTRMLRIREEKEVGIRLDFYEMPNNKIADSIIERALDESSALSFVVDLLERRFGENFIQKKLERSFSPTLVGIDTSIEGYEAIVAEENQRAANESLGLRLLRKVVDTFFKEDKEEPSLTEKGEGELIEK